MWLGEAADRRPTRCTPRARMPVKGRAGCQGRRGAWRCGARTGAEMAQGKRFCHCASLMRTGVVWPSCGPCRVVLSIAPHPACIRQSFTTTALFGCMRWRYSAASMATTLRSRVATVGTHRMRFRRWSGANKTRSNKKGAADLDSGP